MVNKKRRSKSHRHSDRNEVVKLFCLVIRRDKNRNGEIRRIGEFIREVLSCIVEGINIVRVCETIGRKHKLNKNNRTKSQHKGK